MKPADPALFQVRDPELTEFEALTRLWYQAWQDAHARILPETIKNVRTLDNFRERLKLAWPNLRVTGPRGEPQGLCAIKADELWQLFVAASGRGTGMANALLADGERRLSENGVRIAWLACAIGNDRAARFYEKSGWARVENGVNLVDMPRGGVYELEVWRYEKRLAR
jgi:GNAT superfamily N-acetyltransferase